MNTSIVTKRGLSVGSRAELIERQFKALCLVSQTLCRAKNIEETLDGILAVLHKESGLLHGVPVSVWSTIVSLPSLSRYGTHAVN